MTYLMDGNRLDICIGVTQSTMASPRMRSVESIMVCGSDDFEYAKWGEK
jgi:hypothetical protein